MPAVVAVCCTASSTTCSPLHTAGLNSIRRTRYRDGTLALASYSSLRWVGTITTQVTHLQQVTRSGRNYW